MQCPYTAAAEKKGEPERGRSNKARTQNMHANRRYSGLTMQDSVDGFKFINHGSARWFCFCFRYSISDTPVTLSRY